MAIRSSRITFSFGARDAETIDGALGRWVAYGASQYGTSLLESAKTCSRFSVAPNGSHPSLSPQACVTQAAPGNLLARARHDGFHLDPFDGGAGVIRQYDPGDQKMLLALDRLDRGPLREQEFFWMQVRHAYMVAERAIPADRDRVT